MHGSTVTLRPPLAGRWTRRHFASRNDWWVVTARLLPDRGAARFPFAATGHCTDIFFTEFRS